MGKRRYEDGYGLNVRLGREQAEDVRAAISHGRADPRPGSAVPPQRAVKNKDARVLRLVRDGLPCGDRVHPANWCELDRALAAAADPALLTPADHAEIARRRARLGLVDPGPPPA